MNRPCRQPRAAEEAPQVSAADMETNSLIALKVKVHQRLVREMSMQEFAVSNKVPTGKDLLEMQMRTEAVVSRLLMIFMAA